MALYRKYRPATFAEVVGQEHVTEPLSVALSTGRINHAYLFSGPRGCGKTSSARILARSLNCEQGPTATPCGVCDSCVGLAPGGAGTLDVVELDAASHGGVDDARELRDRAFYSPASSRFRVFIIDEAHMVTTQGFNALLKIVEEPPEHLVFIFATTEPEKVLATIRSRTHHYPFRLLPPATMRGLLEKICEQEQVSVEPAVYPLVIRAGGGSPRDSLSVLDQLLAGAGPEGVTYPRALSLLGVTDVALIDDAVDALAADDGAALFGTVHRLVDAGHDPRRFAIDLLERVRDLILLREIPDAGDRGLVDAPGDVVERMRDEAERIGPATLARYAEIIHTGLGDMRGATAPRLLLEVMCARMLLPSASDAESAVLQRLERVERRMTITPPTEEEPASAFKRPSPQPTPEPAPAAARPRAAEPAPASSTPAPSTPASVAPASVAATPVAPAPSAPAPAAAAPQALPEPEPQRTVVAGQPDAATVRTVWSEVRSAVRERSRTTEVMLSSATVRRLEGDTLVLSHDSEPLAKRLTESRNADVVREALRDVLGVNWNVVCEAGADRAEVHVAAHPAATPPPAPAMHRYTRPSGGGAPSSGSDEVPLPDGPTDPDDPGPGAMPEPEPVDEESMLAEAASGELGDLVGRRDPEEAALELLAAELGAKPLDAR
ncbi:MAG: DNA polymerase III subunits gamma/tau [Mycobacteriaceae bacterium]